MKRLLVYSHNTYKLENHRRVFAITNYLLDTFEDLSILLVSGSPMVQSFRGRHRLDYVKLPQLRRMDGDGYASRFPKLDVLSVSRTRSEMIDAALHSFRPDLILVDKKPYGVNNELALPLHDYKLKNPSAKIALMLRDIPDDSDTIRSGWTANQYFDAIETLYDTVLVLGSSGVYDLRTEYRLPAMVAAKVHYCGYLYRQPAPRTPDDVRAELRIEGKERLVLVTAGCGEDGYDLLNTYIEGIKDLPDRMRVRSLLVTGPDMPQPLQQSLHKLAAGCDGVSLIDFTDDLTSYMAAADLIVCMCGYNTISELMSLKKRAIVVPRLKPYREQMIRAERLALFGQFTVVHPDDLEPTALAQMVLAKLDDGTLLTSTSAGHAEFGGHDRLSSWVSILFGMEATEYPPLSQLRAPQLPCPNGQTTMASPACLLSGHHDPENGR
jgi:predicted glycosyltransferase